MNAFTTQDYEDSKKWKKVSLADIMTPKSGRLTQCDSWWFVTPDDCVLFFKGHLPQYNINEELIRSLHQRMHPACRILRIGVAYLPHRCSDFV